MSVSTIWSPFPQVREPRPLRDGLVLWLDADDLSTITKDGGNLVSQWRDKSGGGNHAEASGIYRPLWVDAQLNNVSVIRFDGIQDVLNAGSGSDFDNITIFMVFKYVTGGVNGGNILRKWGSDGVIISAIDLDNNPYAFTVNTWETYRVTFPTADISTYSLLTCRHDKSLGSDNIQVWVDGVSKGTDNCTVDAGGDGADLVIGAAFADGGFAVKCDIGEVVIYDTPLGASDLAQVESYLNLKWGL